MEQFTIFSNYIVHVRVNVFLYNLNTNVHMVMGHADNNAPIFPLHVLLHVHVLFNVHIFVHVHLYLFMFFVSFQVHAHHHSCACS